MSEEHKARVQAQFGAAAEAYATSKAHAQGQSLAILAEWIQPEPEWEALDVGTGAGHTALLFAPRVKRMTASDITGAMLAKAAELAAQRGLNNFETRPADAENLPFEAGSFDLVTCRIALHHFANPQQALSEFARVLKPGGVLGFADNVTAPDKQAAGYHNAFEKLRDPSHHWVYPLPRLQAMVERAGFEVERVSDIFSKESEFHDWAGRQRVSAANKEKLLAMMRNLPEALQPLLAPRWADGTLYFSQWEVVIVGRVGER